MTAVITGDPDRVPHLAGALGETTATWSKRGYECAEVDAAGTPVLVCSTGIGGPSTAIVTEELVQVGIGRVIRVGTCGSMQPGVNAGDLVIPSGCVRDEGTSHQFLPPQFPAVPDFWLLAALVEAAERAEVRFHVGVTHCKDAYYAERPDGFPLADRWRERWASLREAGVLATEMEAAALFTVAATRGIPAAAVLVPVDRSITAADALTALRRATQIACEGAASLASQPDR